MGNCASTKRQKIWVHRYAADLRPYNTLVYTGDPHESIGELLQRVGQHYQMTYVNIYQSNNKGQCDFSQQLQPNLYLYNFEATNHYGHPIWFTATDDVLAVNVSRVRSNSSGDTQVGAVATGTAGREVTFDGRGVMLVSE